MKLRALGLPARGGEKEKARARVRAHARRRTPQHARQQTPRAVAVAREARRCILCLRMLCLLFTRCAASIPWLVPMSHLPLIPSPAVLADHGRAARVMPLAYTGADRHALDRAASHHTTPHATSVRRVCCDACHFMSHVCLLLASSWLSCSNRARTHTDIHRQRPRHRQARTTHARASNGSPLASSLSLLPPLSPSVCHPKTPHRTHPHSPCCTFVYLPGLSSQPSRPLPTNNHLSCPTPSLTSSVAFTFAPFANSTSAISLSPFLAER